MLQCSEVWFICVKDFLVWSGWWAVNSCCGRLEAGEEVRLWSSKEMAEEADMEGLECIMEREQMGLAKD